MNKNRKLGKLLFSLAVFGLLLFAWLNRLNIYDWYKLRGYQPPAQVEQLAVDTTMTSYAKHMFYINHPDIEDKAKFNQSCPNDTKEQTIVLGCYRGNETGIFLYNVTDAQLAGVMQVTAAHETLHAIYERLDGKERDYVDGLLEDFYQHDLHNERLLKTIDAYKQSEPNDLVNEMHSIFGTEVVNLPQPLEDYYKQYFTDRSKIAAFAASYQQAFTSREDQIKLFDQQLNNLKTQIDAEQADLGQQEKTLEAQRVQLDQQLAAKQYS